MHDRAPTAGNGKDLAVHQTFMRENISPIGRQFRQLDTLKALQT